MPVQRILCYAQQSWPIGLERSELPKFVESAFSEIHPQQHYVYCPGPIPEGLKRNTEVVMEVLKAAWAEYDQEQTTVATGDQS